jgi:hypothetical protein
MRTASITIALVKEAVRTSEMSVNFNEATRHYIPEDYKLHTRCSDNLKSHTAIIIIFAIIQASRGQHGQKPYLVA